MDAYKDADHPSNKIRPNVRCWGCGKKGCVGKHWGNWCFSCNVKRIERIKGWVMASAGVLAFGAAVSALPPADLVSSVILLSLAVQIICVSEVCDAIRETRKDCNGPRS